MCKYTVKYFYAGGSSDNHFKVKIFSENTNNPGFETQCPDGKALNLQMNEAFN